MTTIETKPTLGAFAIHRAWGRVHVVCTYRTTATIRRWGTSKLDSGKLITVRGVNLTDLSPAE